MSMINNKDIEYIAGLARLDIGERDIQLFTRKLNTILEYVKILDEIEKDESLLSASLFPAGNVFREDELKPSMDSEKALSSAAERGQVLQGTRSYG